MQNDTQLRMLIKGIYHLQEEVINNVTEITRKTHKVYAQWMAD